MLLKLCANFLKKFIERLKKEKLNDEIEATYNNKN
jgi:hypothetical protein